MGNSPEEIINAYKRICFGLNIFIKRMPRGVIGASLNEGRSKDQKQISIVVNALALNYELLNGFFVTTANPPFPRLWNHRVSPLVVVFGGRLRTRSARRELQHSGVEYCRIPGAFCDRAAA